MADGAKSDEDLLATARKQFARAEEREQINRDNYVADVRFARLNEQWPEEVREKRRQEGRPCLTVNRLPAFIRQVTNDARQNSPSIKFHPVGDGADQETAKILDGLTRNIEYSSNADVAYDNALDNAVTGGFGYFRIVTDYASDDTFDQDIRIEVIKNPLTVYGDPDDMGSDSANWDVAFVTEMIPRATFEKRWPKAEVSSFEADSHDMVGWFNEDEIRVAEYWVRDEVIVNLLKLSDGTILLESEYDADKRMLFEGLGITIVDQRPTRTKKVTQYLITGCEVLEKNDWAGKYIPIVPVYGDEVVIDGERHLISLIRFAKDPQQMLNYWRTTSTELVALAPKAPWVGAVGQFSTDTRWATANTETHQYLEYDAVDVNGTLMPPPQRQPFAGVPAGALQEAMNASDDMKSIMGLYDASLGAVSNETSGRAILARQREGDVSTFNFTDNLSRAIRHAGRILCDLIPKVYSTPRIIRVINEDNTNESIPINGMQPTPEQIREQREKQAEMRAIGRVYSLTTGKYDVTCEAGPSYTTRREESAVQMMEFVRVFPQAAPFIGDLLAKNLDWMGAEQIAERLREMLPPQLKGQNPEAMAAQQQIQQMAQLLQQMQGELQKAKEDQANEKYKLQIDAYGKETDRIKSLGLQASPEMAAMLGLQVTQQALNSPDILPPQGQQPEPQGVM
jgi:hypothetical protein